MISSVFKKWKKYRANLKAREKARREFEAMAPGERDTYIVFSKADTH